MSYKVAIKKTATGEVRIHEDNGDWIDGKEWQWTEGNYGCDCNRSLFWMRADPNIKDPVFIDESDECGENKYTIEWVELPSGERFTI